MKYTAEIIILYKNKNKFYYINKNPYRIIIECKNVLLKRKKILNVCVI